MALCLLSASAPGVIVEERDQRLRVLRERNLRASLEYHLGPEKAEAMWGWYAERYPDRDEMLSHLAIALADLVMPRT